MGESQFSHKSDLKNSIVLRPAAADKQGTANLAIQASFTSACHGTTHGTLSPARLARKPHFPIGCAGAAALNRREVNALLSHICYIHDGLEDHLLQRNR